MSKRPLLLSSCCPHDTLNYVLYQALSSQPTPRLQWTSQYGAWLDIHTKSNQEESNQIFFFFLFKEGPLKNLKSSNKGKDE